jgi:hypothetical protein
MEAKFYSQTCTLSIQLERLVSTFDGTDQLAKAISRIISNWDDVWGDFSIAISSKMVTRDWGALKAEERANTRAVPKSSGIGKVLTRIA